MVKCHARYLQVPCARHAKSATAMTIPDQSFTMYAAVLTRLCNGVNVQTYMSKAPHRAEPERIT
jgi:hypothetical protein